MDVEVRSSRIISLPTRLSRQFILIPFHSFLTALNDLQGLVDLDFEIAKSDKKLDLARLNLGKIDKAESAAGYLETVPENIRVVNGEKVSACLSNSVSWLLIVSRPYSARH